MAVKVMVAQRLMAFQFDYPLDNHYCYPNGMDHLNDSNGCHPVAEREQIHLDIQLRFHQKNDLKDFEIAQNSRPLRITLGFGTVHSYRAVHFQDRLLSLFKNRLENLQPASYGSL